MGLDEAIQKIDNYIQQIIQDMIDFRTKRLEASSKVLDKIKALMEALTYSYRLGELYDKVIKIERVGMAQRDITAPRIQVKYTGSKMRLYTDSTYVDVPEVPVFVWETKKGDQLSYEAGVETLRRNLAIKLPTETSVEEQPDIENTFGKFYFLDFYGYSYEYVENTLYSGKKISLLGIVYEIQNIKIQHRVYFKRELTINGTKYLFNIVFGFGRLYGSQYFDPSTTITDIELPCTLISFTTDYTGQSSAIIFGNEYTSKSYETGTTSTRDILIVFKEGEPIAFQLN